ncbi:metal-dependent transcriptional regulator [Vicingus serpentipes]|uniref:Transcriptional regulator MntR n=1 Tax=Vicingus serpentipes TaxID=1926625 RepID=A0A5C6RY97_9FLAO|nr:metal-dependent transcriptional regulator [Vicingus serpentipes]TXB67054.1 metal-dependent transcriptional regulator [Vicingus serpentipes]
MNSFTEENYLKAIFKLSKGKTEVSTNAVAAEMDTKASSVTDMLKKLADKKLVNYAPYKGVNLTETGKQIAISIVRKHRLWEVFLVDKLNFKWDEVHDIAEQLEHIQSNELVERLDHFLENPKYDPHGDPIPDKDGNIARHKELTLADLNIGEKGVIVGVKEHSKSFLNYLDQLNLVLGTEIAVTDKIEFDNSMSLKINKKSTSTVSNQASKNLYIKKIN